MICFKLYSLNNIYIYIYIYIYMCVCVCVCVCVCMCVRERETNNLRPSKNTKVLTSYTNLYFTKTPFFYILINFK